MNLINISMESSAVSRKMLRDAGDATSGGEAAAKAKATSKNDVSLFVKKELASVPSLDIQLKPGEVKKLRQIQPEMPSTEPEHAENSEQSEQSSKATGFQWFNQGLCEEMLHKKQSNIPSCDQGYFRTKSCPE